MQKDSKIFVAGHGGLVGSALVRALRAAGHTAIMTRTRSECDLTRQDAVDALFEAERPEYVLLAAARVGGIHANDIRPAEFIRDNLAIQTNVIHSAWKAGVRKLLFLGSSCIYPKFAPQPLREEYLLSGALEPTNQWYAVAKIAGIKMCQAYRRQYGFAAICLMPTNLYGPHDNFDAESSHVLPALMGRFHAAKAAGQAEVAVWGSGTPRREFLHVDDLASACLHLMDHYDAEEIVNVGSGQDVTIAELAGMVAEAVGYQGRIVFDPSRPDGTPRKLLDVSRLRELGWRPGIGLREGIAATYRWFLERPGA
ncbi:GDP-L-fucose synthase [Desulfocurvus sp.]|jgi:GDP-L-fucose synthase|uniref:GDP-L-fucose synthase family protein n=1 Tax=Desulfocurvus sp. TaxID=2871698 RepID=UPI0025BB444B|nr:GDP-L-fucose synthase [Desulfocurvus sp.]MCK9240617.1 GDP-L-fucose synthase [Desulfocurvus sp.]